jgi:hypothetical protein
MRRTCGSTGWVRASARRSTLCHVTPATRRGVGALLSLRGFLIGFDSGGRVLQKRHGSTDRDRGDVIST